MLYFPYISRLQQLLVFVDDWLGITVLKDHTLWQMFMPLPANSLMQSARHATAHFLQFSNKNTKTTDLYIKHENSQFANVHSIQCLGLVIENNVLWHCHIDQTISKLHVIKFSYKFQVCVNLIMD
jgi:hypothetical protein